MSNLKFSALWAILGIVIGALTITINWFYGPFYVYRILMAPGNFVASFFIHEIEFWFKVGLLLFGEYGFCLIVIFIFRKLFIIPKHHSSDTNEL